MNTHVPRWVWYAAGLLAILAIGLAGLYMFRLVFTPPTGGGGEFALIRQMMQMLESGYRNDAWSRFWATLLTGIGFLMAVSIPSLGIAVLLYRGRDAFGKEAGKRTELAKVDSCSLYPDGGRNSRPGTERELSPGVYVPEEVYPPLGRFPDGTEDPRIVGGYRFPVHPKPDFDGEPSLGREPEFPHGVEDPEGRYIRYLQEREAA